VWKRGIVEPSTTSKELTVTIHAEAMKIDELAYNLGNISHDDKKQITDYTVDEIVNEAKYVLGLFLNPNEGHINNEALRGDEGPEQRQWARKQVRQLKAFIKKHS
jgi:hypothetical protein